MIVFGSPAWDAIAGTAADVDAVERRGAVLTPDDAINIQYTSGTTGSPKGATLSHHNILNNGYFVTELLAYTEADRVCLPVPFYHCFGMIMGNLGATSHGSCIVIPAPAFDAEATLRGGGAGALHVAVRRADDVHRRARPPRLRVVRPGVAADGHHGRLALPGRGHEARHRPHAHGEVAICYGMTETSPVSTQTRADDSLERRVGTVGRPGPHIEVKVVDPATRADGAARRAGRAVHARLQRDARLLGGRGAHRRGHRRGALDAHRRPRDDGRLWCASASIGYAVPLTLSVIGYFILDLRPCRM